jgi:hypothetical protein
MLMMAKRERATYLEYPRDLFKRGRPPKRYEKLAAFFRQIADPPGLTRALALEEQGHTIPEIARELRISERTVQRWFKSLRLPRLDYSTLQGAHPHFGGLAQSAGGRIALAVELSCPWCGKGTPTVMTLKPTEITKLMAADLRMTCPDCQRPGRFTVSRYVQLTIAQVREWPKARTRIRRADLFWHAMEDAPANEMLTGRSTQAVAGRQKPRKQNG